MPVRECSNRRIAVASPTPPPLPCPPALPCSEAYGVLSADGIALRGLFIIDREGVVQHSTINNLAFGRNVDEVLRTLQALQYVQEHPDEVCPAGWKPGKWQGAGAGRVGDGEDAGGGWQGCSCCLSDAFTGTVGHRGAVLHCPVQQVHLQPGWGVHWLILHHPLLPPPPRRRQDHEARCRPGVLRRHLSGQAACLQPA